MGEVMSFIQKWLEHRTHAYEFMTNNGRSPSVKYNLVAAQKDKATELRDKLDCFRIRFMDDLTIEIQGLIFVPNIHIDCPTCLIQCIRCHGEVYGRRICSR